MLIDLRQLLSGNKDSVTVEGRLDMSVFDDGVSEYAVSGKEPFELKLVKLGKNRFTIAAKSFVVLDIPCDRCLEPVSTRIDFEVNTAVDMEELAEGGEEREEKDYIDGYNLDVDRLVFDEILLSMPGKTLCREDCKGLCLKCGANLNIAECGCDRSVTDPRMSVFKDILNNFKEV